MSLDWSSDEEDSVQMENNTEPTLFGMTMDELPEEFKCILNDGGIRRMPVRGARYEALRKMEKAVTKRKPAANKTMLVKVRTGKRAHQKVVGSIAAKNGELKRNELTRNRATMRKESKKSTKSKVQATRRKKNLMESNGAKVARIGTKGAIVKKVAQKEVKSTARRGRKTTK